MTRIPENFVKQGLAMACDMTLFGVPFLDMTRDELIAAAVKGWEAYDKILKERMNKWRHALA